MRERKATKIRNSFRFHINRNTKGGKNLSSTYLDPFKVHGENLPFFHFYCELLLLTDLGNWVEVWDISSDFEPQTPGNTYELSILKAFIQHNLSIGKITKFPQGQRRMIE